MIMKHQILTHMTMVQAIQMIHMMMQAIQMYKAVSKIKPMKESFNHTMYTNNFFLDDLDDGEKTDDDSDEYTPQKDYKKRLCFVEKLKRKRGRPKKIRSPAEYEDGKRKKKNWREGKIFKCPHCVKTFTRRHRVSIHIQLRHGFDCPVCQLK